MQKQFNNYFRDLKTNRSLNNHSFDEHDKLHSIKIDYLFLFPSFYLENGLVITEPEEIKINAHNGILTLSTKKEKNYFLHESPQTYISPKELKTNDLKSTYTENGILSIETPLPKDEPKHSQIRIERILEKSELQVSDKERAQRLENTYKEITSLVSGKCINLETKCPYTISMIGQAMRDIHFSFNRNRNAKQQVEIVL
ncbi:unnamed protein product [Rotaria sordida]|uniref:SHSP domain-containing protein n=1 Tax=Rotaria sordida TaxID=392033 RepID=A0A816EII8_9BILA|nr:unnamed protein product [Rotaria sordida]CAF1647153.1 unnamed protein product [Rotaria sordida]